MTGSRHLVLLAALTQVALGLDNGVGRTPPMGWNSWFALGCSSAMNASTVRAEAQFMVQHGLKDLGYTYVNLDDCYIEPGAGGRDPVTHKLQPANATFGGTAGLTALATDIHSMGLRFGIYTDRGSQTCMHRAGSRHYESIDAQTFVDWGVDFIKEDSCAAYQNPDKAIPEYSLMRDALNKTGKPVFFSLCGWHSWYAPPIPYLNYTGGDSLGNSARISTDDNSWSGVIRAGDVMAGLSAYARPGYWNDPDLLLSVDINGRARMTENQTRAQFSLWSVLSAPLLISGHFQSMSNFTLDTYTNVAAIGINQRGGTQGSRLSGGDLSPCVGKPVANCTNVWGKNTTSAGDQKRTWALLVLNAGAVPGSATCNATCFGGLGIHSSDLPLQALDVWSGATFQLAELQYSTHSLAPDGGHTLLQLSSH